MMKKVLIGAALLAAAAPANAVTFTFTPSSTGDTAAPGYVLVNTFETALEKAALVGTGFSFYTTGVSGEGAQPAGLTDPNTYAAVKSGGSGTLSFASLVKSFSVYIGSVDGGNKITFNYSDLSSDSIFGTSLTTAHDGSQTSAQNNGLFTFFGTAGKSISSVTFGSSVNSFEFDNISAQPVPEAATWLMMLGGFGLIGYAARRTRPSVSFG